MKISTRLPSLLVLVQKKGFNISENFFRKLVLERYGNLPKENKLKGYGHFKCSSLLLFIFTAVFTEKISPEVVKETHMPRSSENEILLGRY